MYNPRVSRRLPPQFTAADTVLPTGPIDEDALFEQCEEYEEDYYFMGYDNNELLAHEDDQWVNVWTVTPTEHSFLQRHAPAPLTTFGGSWHGYSRFGPSVDYEHYTHDAMNQMQHAVTDPFFRHLTDIMVTGGRMYPAQTFKSIFVVPVVETMNWQHSVALIRNYLFENIKAAADIHAIATASLDTPSVHSFAFASIVMAAQALLDIANGQYASAYQELGSLVRMMENFKLITSIP